MIAKLFAFASKEHVQRKRESDKSQGGARDLGDKRLAEPSKYPGIYEHYRNALQTGQIGEPLPTACPHGKPWQ